jgi:putative NADPH-quinone reductase
MRISVILGHPSPGSFNHAIAARAQATLLELGHQVSFHDLYAEDFPPLLPGAEIPREAPLEPLIRQHCQELAEAQGIVIIHPNWWGQPPAMLKGWVDRVFRPGWAYEFLEGDSGAGVPQGLLQARCALVFNTSNTPRERELTVFGDPLETIWRHCIFGLCGVQNFWRRNFEVVVTSTLEQRRAWLQEVQDLVARCFPQNQDLGGCG